MLLDRYRVAVALVLLALLTLAVARLRRGLVVVTVTGTSMTPTLLPGDQVIVRRCDVTGLRVGDIVVLEPPRPPSPYAVTVTAPDRVRPRWNVKRVAALPGDPVPEEARAAAGGLRVVPAGSLVVIGDGTGSRDSRHNGFYSAGRILGVVIRPGRLARR
ncbi:hypothetical protein Skr01_36030 [Sphaerisporangium krabiense]|uniref:Mitochondrial inner membrane protease subunit 2 n=1 Tax=Sphaerisporangium krabiense TaxID=763782 RepID=A0A7W8Z3B7_9ACTN|nr:S26 family signal peptidase [Sphaerisporangium krabiense]MBB5626597.1 signal peptidase I [Sphaerisporangium krabiense]GII63518.1 hypothetical protein Skr01_36030 [Sphaerisporangium krabiense]